jgi:hypothetical protein
MADFAPVLAGTPHDPLDPASAVGARSPSLVLSDYLFLFAFMLALFIIVDPFDAGFERPANTKHIPLVFLLASWLLSSVGAWLSPVRGLHAKRSASLLSVTWPFALLGTWIMFGGLYTRLADGIKDTFMVTGLYMLAGLAAAHVVRQSKGWETLVNRVCRFISIAAAYMIGRMAVEHVWSGGRYHELEFLVVPVAVYFAMRPTDHPIRQGLLVLFFLAGGIMFLKNTGFIVLSITLVYLFWADWRFQLRDSRRLYRCVLFGALAAAVVVTTLAAAGKLLSEDVSLPSGNPGYRLRTYDKAVIHFKQSPVWGTLFNARSTAHFTAFDIDEAGGNLPTHSDILDIAANGGVIALGLLFWGYFRIARLGLASGLRSQVKTNTTAALHMTACMVVSGIAVYAFNPIMLQPERAILLWGVGLGILLGICLHGPASAPAASELAPPTYRGA